MSAKIVFFLATYPYKDLGKYKVTTKGKSKIISYGRTFMLRSRPDK